jgi:putative membrane protein
MLLEQYHLLQLIPSLFLYIRVGGEIKMHYWEHPNMVFGYHTGGLIGLFIYAAFWIFVAFLILTIVRIFRGQKGFNKENGNETLEILKKRYAKGEINKKEFREMKKEIS